MEIRVITGEFKLIGNYFRLISLSPTTTTSYSLASRSPPSFPPPPFSLHHAPTRRRPPGGTPEAGIGLLTPPASRTRRLGRPPSSPGWWVLPVPSLSLFPSPELDAAPVRDLVFVLPSNLRFRAFAPVACFFSLSPLFGRAFFFGAGPRFV
jgi:hypothetical protein